MTRFNQSQQVYKLDTRQPLSLGRHDKLVIPNKESRGVKVTDRESTDCKAIIQLNNKNDAEQYPAEIRYQILRVLLVDVGEGISACLATGAASL